MSDQEQQKIVQESADKLGENFDAVLILVTSADGSGTDIICKGCGNYYARMGMAHEFINADKAQDAAVQIAEKIKESKDE